MLLEKVPTKLTNQSKCFISFFSNNNSKYSNPIQNTGRNYISNWEYRNMESILFLKRITM